MSFIRRVFCCCVSVEEPKVPIVVAAERTTKRPVSAKGKSKTHTPTSIKAQPPTTHKLVVSVDVTAIPEKVTTFLASQSLPGEKLTAEAYLQDYYQSLGERVRPIAQDSNREILKLLEQGDIFKRILTSCAGKEDTPLSEVDMKLAEGRDVWGDTFLHRIAGWDGHGEKGVELAKKALKRGDSLKARNKEGMTPLHVALGLAKQKNFTLALIPYLIKEAARTRFDFSQQDNYGRNVLHIAALSFYTSSHHRSSGKLGPIMAQLLEHFPLDRINDRDQLGLTAIDCAIISNNMGALKALLQRGANPRAGLCSSKKSTQELIGQMFDREEEILFRRGRKRTLPPPASSLELDITSLPTTEVISRCVAFENIDEALFLKQREDLAKLGERPDVLVVNSEGYSLLHVAVLADSAALAKKLLLKSADPHYPNNEGITPFMWALSLGRKEVFFAFLEMGVTFPIWVEKDDGDNPIPFLLTAVLRCRQADILAEIFRLNQTQLQGKFTLQLPGLTPMSQSLIDWSWWITPSNPIATFELLKKECNFKF